ncbi:MAG: M28 family peptidase, partial [Phycisphaerales bacterium]|nr:M28 family peptidase [Phycisphaerales bacterium]
FPLAGERRITEQMLTLEAPRGGMTATPGTDVVGTALGGAGEVTGPLTFVGYSIDNGPDDYSSYGPDDDLTGRIAVMYRFEPMNDAGTSLWGNGRWSNRASFQGKIRAALDRNAAAIIVINTPGADDPRIESLAMAGGGGGRRGGSTAPVMLMSVDAGSRLLELADPAGRTARQLRSIADEGAGLVALDGLATVRVAVEETPVVAENIAGIVPGRGALADEYIVIGAHLDHLGMGEFGSRTGPGKLHPGADDNASGSAGIILLAQKLSASYAALPADADARSILLMTFSAEESGLNGSRYYVEHPIVPIDQHVLMVNFDMIGRILNDRLSVSGAYTGEGLGEFLEPFFAASGLEIVQPATMSGASDHTPFQRKGMPVLFGIIADFHQEYHTPEDVSYKINRVGAVKTIRMFHDIALAMATRPDSFPVATRDAGGDRAPGGPQLSDITVRFGIMPGTYEAGDPGIPIRDVTEGGSAALAGLQPDDRLMTWNKEEITDMRAWMTMLASHKPGDEVQLGVLRDGEMITLFATLQAKGGG